MPQDMVVADALTQHVFGPSDPSAALVESGRFPPGWVDEYRQRLDRVVAEWAEAPTWPRYMVGALHYALTHLRTRYLAWQAFNGRRDEGTEQDLCRVEGLTRILFARAFSRDAQKSAEQPGPPDCGGIR